MILGIVASSISKETNLFEFDVTLTTPSAGALTNVTGTSWTVVRDSTAEHVDASGDLVEVAADIPRVDYFTSTKMLIESSVSQLIDTTDDIDSTGWFNARLDFTYSQSSPDGDSNAILMSQQTGETVAGANIAIGTYVQDATDYVFSVYAKAGTYNFLHMNQYGSTNTDRDTWFNLSTGAVGTSGTANTASIVDYGSGWYKCSIKYTSGYDNIDRQHKLILADTDGSENVTDNQGGVYIFKPNLKQESSDSSNIQNTTTSTFTRAADVITNTVPANAYTMSEWISSVEQTAIPVVPGEIIKMKNLTTKMIMNAGTTPLMAFTVDSTTASTGSLTNVIGSSWTVDRDSVATYKNDSGVLTTVAVDVPRIQDDKVLIESAATNEFTYSKDLTQWPSDNITVALAAGNSPAGSVDSYEITDDTTDGFHRLKSNVISVTSSDVFTMSVFAKESVLSEVNLKFYDGSTNYAALFNLSDGTVTTELTVTNSSIILQNNGWYKCSMTGTVSNTLATSQPLIYVTDGTSQDGNGNISYAGADEELLLYGASFTKSALSSYIETTGTVATREADVITNTVPAGASNMETWIDGVSDGGQSVTPATTITMLNGTTKIVIT